jgi:Glycosyl transferases group 1
MTGAASGARFLTTLPYTRRAAWTARAEIVDPIRLVRRAGNHEAVVLNGSVRTDQLAAALVARRRTRPAVVLADATWKDGGRARRAAVRAIDHRDAHYCVLSQEEATLFPATWGVAPEHVHVTPFHWVLDESQVEELPDTDGTIFAGGDSLRDYRPLLEAAEGLAAGVTIASRSRAPVRAPANVTIGELNQRRYEERFRSASIVVVPLAPRRDRSAGQQTYLNAMVLGKPVVVTDALGVREYVEDGRTGLIVPPGDAAAMRAALGWLLDPANAGEVRAIGERARAVALERFGPEQYVRRLVEVVDLALAARE